MTERPKKISKEDIQVHDQMLVDKNRLVEASLVGADVTVVETSLLDLGKETEPYTEKDIDKLMEKFHIAPTAQRGRKPRRVFP